MATRRTTAPLFSSAAEVFLAIEQLRSRALVRDVAGRVELTPAGHAAAGLAKLAGRERRRPGHRRAA